MSENKYEYINLFTVVYLVVSDILKCTRVNDNT